MNKYRFKYALLIKRILNSSTLSVLFMSALLFNATSASALEFKANQWQLVSFPRLPVDASIDTIFGEAATDTNGALSAVWTFDNNTKEWQSWPSQSGLATSNLSELTLGQGYWVKTQSDLVLDVLDATEAVGEMTLYPGWNLIGLSVDQTMGHEQALAGVPFLELWKYDSNQNKFLSVQKSRGSQIILKEEFSQIEASQGLWVYMAEQSTLLPSMGTLLPPDIDIEPLLNLSTYGSEAAWDQVTPGDIDWDEDGYFDFPNTQTQVSFGDFLNRQRLSITNEGNGVLCWQATIEPAVDWLLFEAFDEEDQPVLTNIAMGNVSSTFGELVLVANRTGMAPSDNYKTQIVLRANGSLQEKRIDVSLAVADVVGDYEMTVRLDEINDKQADLHNPKYFLSFARDGEGVKAFLDEERSLLIPQLTYLSGDYVADPQSHFQVLGQLYLPQGHEHNPYESDIRREFTIVGQRSDGKDGLSPLDLKGTYSENIYGIFDEPIQLSGEFVGIRLSPTPKKKDQSISDIISGEILAEDSSVFEVDITDRYSITDIKTALRIEHSQPESLIVKLTGPQWTDGNGDVQRTTLVLHDKQTRSLTDVQFDDYDAAIDSLDNFDGQLSFGKWTLEIINSSTSVGFLNAWNLDISGATVYKLTGTVADAGIRIQISGCGVVDSVITDSSGNFSFDGLIPCDYELKVLQLGYEITTTGVRIIGCMQGQVCNTQADFTQVLDVQQIADLQPQLVTSSGAMKVLVSPTSGQLPITLQAVDVTDYAQLDKTIQSRTWQLYKRVNATTAISKEGFLIDVEPSNGYVSYGKNYTAYSEDFSKWNSGSSITLGATNVIDPRGGYNAVKVSHTGVGTSAVSTILKADNQGQGGFSVKEGDFVTNSIFVKAGSSNEIRFRFANASEAFLSAEVLDFTTGEYTGGNNLQSSTQPLANGWYRASATYQVTQDYENFHCDLWFSKGGTYNLTTPEDVYVFGPQCEVTGTSGRVDYQSANNYMPSPYAPESWQRNSAYNLISNVILNNPSGYETLGLAERINDAAAAGNLAETSLNASVTSGEEFYLAVIAKSITNDNSFRLRFNDEIGFLGSVSINIDSGVKFSGGGGDINQMWQVTDLSDGFKLFETKMTAHRDSNDLWAQIIFEKKDGSVQAPALGSKAYVQAAFFGKSNDWPAIYTAPKAIEEITASDYIPTGTNHAERSVNGQQEVLIAEQTTGLSGSFSHQFTNNRHDAGAYFVKLNSDVKNASNQDEQISYQTLDVLAFKNPEDIHLGSYSIYGAGGKAGLKAMDMATYDLDRFPLVSESGSQGMEDSDGFKADDIEDDEYQTNAPNDVNEISPGVFSVTPTGLDEPAGNLNQQYRMYISTGQLYQGGSMYSGRIRLDLGIQSQQESN